jgi:hypothetical protein
MAISEATPERAEARETTARVFKVVKSNLALAGFGSIGLLSVIYCLSMPAKPSRPGWHLSWSELGVSRESVFE